MQTIGAAIMKLQNPTDRARHAMAIFGRNGQEMLALFANSGAMDEAAEAVGDKARILDKNSAIFHDITEKLGVIGTKMQGLFYGMAENIAPALKPVLDGLAKMNFTGLGEQIGNVVAFIIEAFSSGEIGTIVGRSLQISFSNAVNFLFGALIGTFYAVGQYFAETIPNIITLFQIVTTADFWKGMGDALLGIAEGFLAFLLDGVAMLLEKLKNIPGIGKKADAAAAGVREQAAKLRAAGQENRDKAADLLTPAVEKVKNRMADMAGNIGAAFQKGQSVAPKLDTSDAEADLDKSVGKVMTQVQKNKDAADKFNQEHKPGQQGPVEEMTEQRKSSSAPRSRSPSSRSAAAGSRLAAASDPFLEGKPPADKPASNHRPEHRAQNRASDHRPYGDTFA